LEVKLIGFGLFVLLPLFKMVFNLEAFIWYLILADSIGANIMIRCCTKWYNKNYKGLARYFPASKGWCGMYLILVIWIGWSLSRLNILPW
jgi:hypothetical protein|tara:strand:- start:167 stop:436 length:270 start_codon:yes stop_codon:yes gene_type:complete